MKRVTVNLLPTCGADRNAAKSFQVALGNEKMFRKVEGILEIPKFWFRYFSL